MAAQGMTDVPKAMTKGEREELNKLVKLNAKVAYADAERRGARLLEDGERKLAAIYEQEDEVFADLTAAAEKAAKVADAAVSAKCRELGIPERFRPSCGFAWRGRGENAYRERRAELRKVLEATVEARVKEAKHIIERDTVAVLTQLAATGLTSDEARAFLKAMPMPEDLMPPIAELQISHGEVVPLVLPAVTNSRNDVTDNNRNDVTVERYDVTEESTDLEMCPQCCGPLQPGKGRYCSNACRQAAYRARRG
jgi:hypothetical protein